MLFTDGSVDTQTGIGYGAYLLVAGTGLSAEELKQQVKVKRFENTTPAKLELQALLWAMDEAQPFQKKIFIYSDSQTIYGLMDRRERLEKNDFRSKGNRLFTNAGFYREFFQKADQLNIELVKVSGHKVSSEKDDIDRLFTLVDRAARNALRKDNFRDTDS